MNLASRICAAAGSGRVLVSETVRQLVGRIEGSEYVDRGFFEIKGFATPQHLFEVDWSGAGAVRAPRVEAGASSTRQAASYPAPSEAQGARRKPLLLGAAILALLLAASIGTVSFMANRGGAGPREVTGEESFDQGPAWKLLRSDDFSSPIRGLFMDKQSGTSGGAFGDGTPYEYRWEYGYADNALVAVLRGLYPERPGAFPYRGIAAADRIPGDFAVEVRGRATRKPDRARYAIDYVVAGEDRYRFEIAPGPSSYGIHLGPMRRNFMASGRTGAVHQADEENHLRMEVRGDTMTVFANGEELDQGQHAGLARRGGTIELVAGMFGTLTDGDVEVRFTDFRVYTLQR